MQYNKFEQLLIHADLAKKEFAKINDIHENSVFNWKKRGVPGWVKPWLENYIKSKAFDHVLETAEKLKNTLPKS